jgi:hypothetical protein
MKNGLLAVLAIAVVYLLLDQRPIVAQEEEPIRIEWAQKWEYAVSFDREEWNKLGEDGFEAFFVTPAPGIPNSANVWFKRPKP